MEIGTLLSVIVGGYLYLEAQSRRFDQLESELLGIAEAERIRDDEWEDDDQTRVADQDRILQAVRVTQDQITSELASQTANLQRLVEDGDERFLQRENRFEELEIGQRATLLRVSDVETRIQFRLGEISERTQLLLAMADST